MAAKKKKASPKPPDEGKLVHLNPDLLDFDLQNLRLSQSQVDDATDEADMIQFLWKEMNIEELALSIAASGYYEHEPLIAEKRGSRFTVIEGNRRLAAVKLLRNRDLQRDINADLPKPSKRVLADLEQLPVVVTSEEKIWQYIGFKHVNGPKPWGAIAKAKYIVRVHEKFGVALEDIPRLIGDTHATVRRLYRGLMVLQQAEDEGLYDLEDRTNKRLFFSHLYTGLSYPSVLSFIGINEKTSYRPKPVRGEKNKKHLGQLCVWLFGSKTQGKQPLIRSQNPDLRRLAEALQTERGRDALTSGLPLDLAYDASIEDDIRFREALIQAKVHLEQAAGIVHTGFEIKSDQLATAKSNLNLAASLLDSMETMHSKSRRRR